MLTFIKDILLGLIYVRIKKSLYEVVKLFMSGVGRRECESQKNLSVDDLEYSRVRASI